MEISPLLQPIDVAFVCVGHAEHAGKARRRMAELDGSRGAVDGIEGVAARLYGQRQAAILHIDHIAALTAAQCQTAAATVDGTHLRQVGPFFAKFRRIVFFFFKEVYGQYGLFSFVMDKHGRTRTFSCALKSTNKHGLTRIVGFAIRQH